MGIPLPYWPASWFKSVVSCEDFRIYHHNHHPRTSSHTTIKKIFVIWSVKCDDVLPILCNPVWLNAFVCILCTQCIQYTYNGDFMPSYPFVFSETTIIVSVVCGFSLNFVKRVELWLMSLQYKHQNIHLNLKLKFISFVKKFPLPSQLVDCAIEN